jgi:hypothetical protein
MHVELSRLGDCNDIEEYHPNRICRQEMARRWATLSFLHWQGISFALALQLPFMADVGLAG